MRDSPDWASLSAHCWQLIYPVGGDAPRPDLRPDHQFGHGGEASATLDEFSRASNGAVLVAQIAAGSVGLNIQAAAVVVICEPQVKPTIEWQGADNPPQAGRCDQVSP